MIHSRTPDAPPPRPARRRRYWLAALLIAPLLVAAGLLLPTVWSSSSQLPVTAPTSPTWTEPSAAAPVTSDASAPAGPASAPPSASAPASEPVGPGDALTLPGKVPARGQGRFAYAPGTSKVFGTTGTLRRYRVAVEHGSGEDVVAVGAAVEATLGDPRSWVGQGQVRLQRVPGNEPASFTVYLATRETAGRMCANGGVNITVNGRPYTSCRSTGRAIINLDRWRLSAPTYVEAGVPLAVYRDYVVNHEVGHELGHRHEGCPKRGGPAPVMVQQTLTLRGCVPYAWPRRDGRLLRGPAL